MSRLEDDIVIVTQGALKPDDYKPVIDTLEDRILARGLYKDLPKLGRSKVVSTVEEVEQMLERQHVDTVVFLSYSEADRARRLVRKYLKTRVIVFSGRRVGPLSNPEPLIIPKDLLWFPKDPIGDMLRF